MYKTRLEEELKQRLPEFQQGSPEFDQFLEAAGQYLDKLREDIDSFQDSRDWKNSSFSQLNDTADQFKIDFPSNVREEVLRLAVRDIVEVYRTKGTERTLKWIFDVINLNVTIRYAWVVNPDTFTPPDPKDVVFSTFWYGREQVDSNGTYFYGVDSFGEEYNKIPIVGEKYPKNARRTSESAMRTPYIFVEVDSSDYQSFAEDFDVEDQTLLDEIIEDYFDEIRPANVAIVVVVTVPDYQDEIFYSPEESVETLDRDMPLTVDGTWPIGEYATNPYTFYEHMSHASIGEELEYIRNREDFETIPSYTLDRNITEANYSDDVHVRSNTFLDTSGTINNGSVTLLVSYSSRLEYGRGEATWEELITLNDTSYNTFLYDVKNVRIQTSSDFDGSFDIQFEMSSPLTPITFTNRIPSDYSRNSEASYVDSDGNIHFSEVGDIRNTYEPLSGEFLGFIMEKSSENSIINSQTLEFSPWEEVDGGVSTSSSVMSPDQTPMYYVFRDFGTDLNASVKQSVPIISSTVYTLSAFCKVTDLNRQISIGVSLDNGAANGTLTFTPNEDSITFDSTEIVQDVDVYYHEYYNDIFRLFVQFNSLTHSECDVFLYANNESESSSEGTYFYGVQLEEDSGSSYIRTTTQTAIREQDNFIIPALPLQLLNTPVGDDLLIFLDFSLFSIVEGQETTLVYLEDGNNNRMSLDMTYNSIVLTSDLFPTIEAPKIMFNENRNNVIHNKLMIQISITSSTEATYTLYDDGSLIGSSDGSRLVPDVSLNFNGSFVGTVHNIYFNKINNKDIIQNNYPQMLEDYRGIQ